jgi:hypothetical protein
LEILAVEQGRILQFGHLRGLARLSILVSAHEGPWVSDHRLAPIVDEEAQIRKALILAA